MTASIRTGLKSFATFLGLSTDYERPPAGLKWRSNTVFICVTVGVGVSVDVFLYSLIVPVIPFILEDRLNAPQDQLQTLTSDILTANAAASLLFSPIAGIIADRAATRSAPFLVGLVTLLLATILLFVGQTFAVLLFARIMQGVSGAVVWTVGLALCIDTVGPANLGKVTGTIFSFVSLASLLGPVAGGTLYKAVGYGGVFAVGAIFLAIDFVMRLLVIEQRVAAKYKIYDSISSSNDTEQVQPEASSEAQEAAHQADADDEETPLLPGEKDKYTIKPSQSAILKHMPILHCFRSASLVAAVLVALIQATLLGAFDSTVPTESKDLFGFDSLKAGLLFIPLGITDLVFGPISGWAVDKYGTKPIGVLAFAFLCPSLILLRLVISSSRDQLILYCALLAVNGIGISATAAPGVVEAGVVVHKYHKANPDLFGEAGPYAQLYGINSMMFSAGLALGPAVAGSLRGMIGYGNMNLVLGLVCATTALICLLFLGGPLRRRISL